MGLFDLIKGISEALSDSSSSYDDENYDTFAAMQALNDYENNKKNGNKDKKK